MSNYYLDTKNYWDKVFQDQEKYNPFNEISYSKIEKAIQWLSCDAKTIIDFGCGTGRVLSRCLDYGVEKIFGIDLSEEAIDLAKTIMKENNLQAKATFKCGGINQLKEINSNPFDGAILFNIIDNLNPDDANNVIEEIARLLMPEGKVILKLNPYFSPDILEKDDSFTKISENFFKESSGLFLWNINNELFEHITTPYFSILHYDGIEFKEYDMVNRLFYLKRK